MKPVKLSFSIILLALMWTSCKKEKAISPGHTPELHIIDTSFSEEFADVYKLESKGWVTVSKNANSGVQWRQGVNGPGLMGFVWLGFPAYSYTASTAEFAYASASSFPVPTPPQINSWLVTPVLSVKNGDKISFYTRARADSGNIEWIEYLDRMQVWINKSPSAETGTSFNLTGSFTDVLFDINSELKNRGYPSTWSRYEYTFSQITGKIITRIGFRYVVANPQKASGIGIDLFRFQVN
jgi:hypothetical protein